MYVCKGRNKYSNMIGLSRSLSFSEILLQDTYYWSCPIHKSDTVRYKHFTYM